MTIKEWFHFFAKRITAISSIRKLRVLPFVTDQLETFLSVSKNTVSPLPYSQAIRVTAMGSVKLILLPAALIVPAKLLQLVVPFTLLATTSKVVAGFLLG